LLASIYDVGYALSHEMIKLGLDRPTTADDAREPEP
jgi:hypothetical protein